ncbi:glycosyltransferase, family 1 (GT1) [Lactiplantibacillus pentosus KCA1]|nr:glycosyltransferase [Lactiplantibacillus pentosus]EIW13624.1 glycosyltransferase, family 1 (GT1) [Lactiplantibacillus pentosus KCA1]
MTKVVHVLFSSKLGGAEQVAINISENLKTAYDFTYVSPAGSIQKCLTDADIEYRTFNPKQIFKFVRTMKAINPDIIHAHDFKASFLVNLLFHHIPIVTHIHQAPEWQTERNWKSIAFKYIGRKSAQVLYVSDYAKESYRYQDKLSNVTVIPNGIDMAQIIKMASQKASQTFDLLFVGRLAEVKDPEKFVEIAQQLVVANSKLKIGIIGDGVLKDRISNLIQATPQIKLLGFQSNPYQYMATAKVVLSTSKSDGFGLTMVEAALLGAIPIAPSIGGIAHTAIKVNGFIYMQEDALVEFLTRLFTDTEFYQENKARLASADLSYYDQPRFVEEIRRVYEEVLSDDRSC